MDLDKRAGGKLSDRNILARLLEQYQYQRHSTLFLFGESSRLRRQCFEAAVLVFSGKRTFQNSISIAGFS